METHKEAPQYDCIIAGGGLAGLSLSILLAREKYSVLLLEKKSYPYHKVCGEYISNESIPFLKRLGLDLETEAYPHIQQLQISSLNGSLLTTTLDLGGRGISRYTLDDKLACIAREAGVQLRESCTVHRYKRTADLFTVESSAGNFSAPVLVSSFGRHVTGNFNKASKEKENWVGVKYHIEYETNPSMISLHTFRDGYCGISAVDEQRSCLCYLVKASLLKKYRNKIDILEKYELRQNPFLREIFSNATFLYEKPLTISNISFDAGSPVEDGVFYIGDSAGSIAPLTGNGMSNAMRSAQLLSIQLLPFLAGKTTRGNSEGNYRKAWKTAFSRRIRKGRRIQNFFCIPWLASASLFMLKGIRGLQRSIIRQTHGDVF